MFNINIHGIPFYGRFNESHFKSLFEIAKITTKEEWKGISGVYVSDGYRETKDKEETYAGQYVSFELINRKSKVTVILKYGDKSKEEFEIYKSPVILIDGGVMKSKQDFIFTLLHELSHHINREKEKYQTLKEKEINAHLFALDKMDKLYNKYSLKRYNFLGEAMEAYKLKKSLKEVTNEI